MRALVIATLAGLTCTATATAGDLFAELKSMPNPVARFERLKQAAASDDPQERGSGMQMLAFQAAELGAYGLAESSFQINSGRQSRGDVTPPAGLLPEAAVHAVVRQSAGKRLVVLNEAHHVARTRWLTLQLLPSLRAQGFSHLALEALDAKDRALQSRGYPLAESGFYTREPVFAELIREALRLGFELLPYEYTGDDSGQQARETGQAEQLAAVLKAKPESRLLVHAGYAHIHRNDPAGSFGARSMLVELETMTGLRALTIDQTRLFDHPTASNDHPALEPALQRWQAVHGRPANQPFVLNDDTGSPWSLRPDVFDISVFYPRNDAMPDWRALDGRRQAQPIDKTPCGDQRPCLLEARAESESDDAVPADRTMMVEKEPAVLWLRPGCYRLTAILANGASPAPARYCSPANESQTTP